MAWNKNAEDILRQDQAEWKGERSFSYEDSRRYKKAHSAWKCLCNGDKPKKDYEW